MESKKLLISAAALGLTLITTSCSTQNNSTEAKVGKCYGINACKGMGDCGGKNHSCAGQNNCKGTSFKKMNKDKCHEKKGRFEKA